MPARKKAFMTCPRCRYEWKTREQFLNDSSISLIGFQADFDHFDESLYLFNHNSKNIHCATTFSIYVSIFLDLHNGPIYDELKTGTEECSGHCLKVYDLDRCTAQCKNVVARDIMRILLDKMQDDSATRNT